MVTGSRFLADDGDGFRSSAPRRVGIRIFSSVLSRIVGQRVTDPTSGLRMAAAAASTCSPATTRTTTPRSRPCCSCTRTR